MFLSCIMSPFCQVFNLLCIPLVPAGYYKEIKFLGRCSQSELSGSLHDLFFFGFILMAAIRVDLKAASSFKAANSALTSLRQRQAMWHCALVIFSVDDCPIL